MDLIINHPEGKLEGYFREYPITELSERMHGLLQGCVARWVRAALLATASWTSFGKLLEGMTGSRSIGGPLKKALSHDYLLFPTVVPKIIYYCDCD